MTRDDFIAANPIEAVIEGRGVRVFGSGIERKCCCLFHEDKEPSMSVNVDKQTWHCFAGCGGGSVIDLLAKLEGKTPVEYMKQNEINGVAKPARTITVTQQTVEKIYRYQNALGVEVFQVLRYKPKTFRQRHTDGKGGWIWNMEGVERVLYRLPDVLKAQTVWIVEGEKDADALILLGFVATCNVGGAGKWLDGYTESLSGKDVVICGDNDEPGRKHVEVVFESIAGRVKSAKLVALPAGVKDASDYIGGMSLGAAKVALDDLAASAMPFVGGVRLPIYTMAELEPLYQKQAQSAESVLDLGRWLPRLGHHIRPLVPGELALLIGDTGTGKTALLQNIAEHARPLPTILFELELPPELLYERFIALRTGWKCSQVEANYRDSNERMGAEHLALKFPHLFICTEARLSLEQLERYIIKSELKIGSKPKVVLLDYIQLIDGKGKRYERTSDAAEGLKVIAKTTKTIVIVASQVHRSEGEDPDINLHSGKDSGSLENSAGLVLGAWRDPSDKALLHLKVLKNTKGTGGAIIQCNFNGETMRITERSTISDEDVP